MTGHFMIAILEDVGFLLLMAVGILSPTLVAVGMAWLWTRLGRRPCEDNEYEQEIFMHDGTAPRAMIEAAKRNGTARRRRR